MLTKEQKKRWIGVVLSVVLALSAVGCSFIGVKDDASDENEAFPGFNISESIIKEIDALPEDAFSAKIIASPVGGNPLYYVLEDSLTYYRYDRWTDQYHECTLTLPEGFTDGRIVYACAGGGSGELDMAVEAKQGEETVYLNYFFYTGDSSENISPVSVTLLDQKQEQHLFEQMLSSQKTADTDSSREQVSEFILSNEDTPEGYWMPAASYGNICDSFAYTYFDEYERMRYVTVIRAGSAEDWYEVFGLQSHRSLTGDFTEYRTYHVTAKNGYITSCEKIPTVTEEIILERGTLYSGRIEGEYSCRSINSNGDLFRRNIEMKKDGTMTVSAWKDGTDAGGVYDGTFQYVTDTGELSAELVLTTYSDGEVTVSDPMKITGKLYEYGGFVHFLCGTSEMYDISPDDPLPLTFAPDETDHTEEVFTHNRGENVLGGEYAGGWYHCFRDHNGSQFYYLEFDFALQQMRWNYGYYESEYINRYTGDYSIGENGVISAVLHDSSILHSDPDITLTFTVNMTENGLALTFLSCDVEKFEHLVDRTVVYDSRELLPPTELEKAGA